MLFAKLISSAMPTATLVNIEKCSGRNCLQVSAPTAVELSRPASGCAP